MTSLTYWKLSLNKFGETFLLKFRTKNVITQKFTFKRSPELVHQLENLFAHLFLQFQLIIIDFHGFIVILVTPPSDQTFGHSILMINHYNIRQILVFDGPYKAYSLFTSRWVFSGLVVIVLGSVGSSLALAVIYLSQEKTTPSNSTHRINPNQTNKSIPTKFLILFQKFRISNIFQIYKSIDKQQSY